MTEFRFEVQECRDVIIEAENAEEGRYKILLMIKNGLEFEDPYVSDGVEVKQ